MGDFQKLLVWKKAKDLAVEVYKVTKQSPFASDFGLRDQIRRAGVSIPSNIAEGDESGSDPQSVRYFRIAKGSCAEVQTQLIIAHEIEYLDCSIFQSLFSECTEISKMLAGLIKSRS